MDQWGPETLHGIAEQLEHDMERDLVMRHITIWDADRKRIRVLEAKNAALSGELDLAMQMYNVCFVGLRDITVGYTFARPSIEGCREVVARAQQALERLDDVQRNAAAPAPKERG